MTPPAGAIDTAPLDGLLAGLRLGLFQDSGLPRRAPGAAADPEADAQVLSRVADWRAVAALARRHHVERLLLRGMRTRPDLLPASGIESRLETACSRNGRRGLVQLGALKRAAERLAAGGLPCLVLKGLPLAQRLYGHPLARDAGDIDLLVPPRTFRDAERMLLESAWRRIEPSFPETPARNRWWARFRHVHALAGPGASLELHRRLSRNPFHFNVPFEDLYARSASVEIGTISFRTLGEDDELAYLMHHGATHFWERLMWLCDVAVLLASVGPGRLEEASARCRQAGLAGLFASTLALCREAFHVRIPQEAARPAGGGRRAVLIARFSRRSWGDADLPRPDGFDWRKKVIRLITAPNSRAVGLEIVDVMVCPRDWGRPDLPDRLFYLYFLLRPLLWLTRKASGSGRTWSRRRGEKPAPALRPENARRGGREDRPPPESAREPRAARSGGRRGRRSLRKSVKALYTFVRAPAGTKAMALEAALFLWVARLLVRHVPLRHWRHRLVTAEEPGPATGRPAAGGRPEDAGDPADAHTAFAATGVETTAGAEASAPVAVGAAVEEHPPGALVREALLGAAQGGGTASAGRTPAQRFPRRVAYIVRKVAHHVPFHAVCLPQAMALQWMLRRRGVPSRLVFGTRREAGGMGLEFHAWLTVAGECVIGAEEAETFTALPSFDGSEPRPG